MTKKIFIALIGLIIGICTTLLVITYLKEVPKKQIIGFLPYWQLNKAQINYENEITTLTYFGLNADGNGHVVKLASPQEENPGWYALESGALTPFLENAKKHNIVLSLLISSGDSSAISQMIANPVKNADNLITDVSPIMEKYNFRDLNLDIEYSAQASGQSQAQFIQFVSTIKQQLIKKNLGTLTIEISPNDVIKNNLINTQAIAPYADSIVLMAYDYHSTTSYVSGPIAPLNGAGIDSEYDVSTAVEKALQYISPQKLILGVPLYGYEWETLAASPRSAIIPGTGVIASNNRLDSLLTSCSTCSATYDSEAQEEFVTYQDETTGTYHQMYFPNAQSLAAKLSFADKEQLKGVALWALGDEGKTTLNPLKTYK